LNSVGIWCVRSADARLPGINVALSESSYFRVDAPSRVASGSVAATLPVSPLARSETYGNTQEGRWDGRSILAWASVLSVEQILEFLLQIV
jgi:hypothetical protein